MAHFRGRVAGLVWCAVALLVSACARAPRDPGPPASGSEGPSAAPEKVEPFSGEIVYEWRVYHTVGPEQLLATYELHYFISGSHWKHTDRDGKLLALYEPASKQIHFFDPAHRAVPASQVDASYELTPSSETRSILGYECKSLQKVWATGRSLEFYTPQLRIDAAPFLDHHFQGWAEFLSFTGGALTLDSEITQDGRRTSVKAIRVERRTFDESFWQVPTEQPPGAKPE
jgi:hypothetical protein